MQYTLNNPLVYFPSVSLEDIEIKEQRKENLKFKILKAMFRKKNKKQICFYNSFISIPKNQTLLIAGK